MRNALCAALLLAVAASAGASERDLTCSATVLNQSWELLRDAGWGRKHTERAAFIVRGTTGDDYTFVVWPRPTESYRADYLGRIPANTVAIIHTHPNEVPVPSAGDSMTAVRTRLPVYVVTRTRIMRDDGGAITTIRTGDWNPEALDHTHSACLTAGALTGR